MTDHSCSGADKEITLSKDGIPEFRYITWVDQALRPLPSQSAQAQERRRRAA